MFEAGSGATYDGSRFARDGIVCVTINYRVGAEGFLYLPDLAAGQPTPWLGLAERINIGAYLLWVLVLALRLLRAQVTTTPTQLRWKKPFWVTA
jgi:hypothetical protein